MRLLAVSIVLWPKNINGVCDHSCYFAMQDLMLYREMIHRVAKNMKRSRKERQHVVFIEINNKPEIITRVGLRFPPCNRFLVSFKTKTCLLSF
jgi:hypothetical protein